MFKLERGFKAAVVVRPVALSRLVVRAHAAVEFASWCCEKCRKTAWDGVETGLVKTITMYGVDTAGEVREAIKMTFARSAEGTLSIEVDGRVSVLDGLDGGLGEALRTARRSMQRRGLRPTARYRFQDEIEADPDRHAAAQRRLGTKSTPIGPWAGGCDPVEVMSITPGKDTGLTFSFWRSGKG